VAGVQVGDRAPDFALESSEGLTYRLSDQRGRWVILAFYPGDFTPVCTRQFCAYRDAADRLDQLEADVIGISPQSVASHRRFTRRHRLTVPLLADPDRAAIRAYGVLGPAGLVRRSIFIVDREGIVRYCHLALLGLHYQDVSALERALAEAKARSR
jgi:peroxiredoxin Q/BCP